jgi:hypothetical protein
MDMVSPARQVLQGPVYAIESFWSGNVALAIADCQGAQAEACSSNTGNDSIVLGIGIARSVANQPGVRVGLIIKILNSSLLNLGKQTLSSDGGLCVPGENNSRPN